MSVFEDLLIELKEEDLLEKTISENSVKKAEPQNLMKKEDVLIDKTLHSQTENSKEPADEVVSDSKSSNKSEIFVI